VIVHLDRDKKSLMRDHCLFYHAGKHTVTLHVGVFLNFDAISSIIGIKMNFQIEIL